MTEASPVDRSPVPIRFLGHASVGIQLDQGLLVTDPLPPVTSDAVRALDDVTCVVISHGHPDHFNPEALLPLVGQQPRVLVPRADGGSRFDASLAEVLRRLGFVRVDELGPYERVRIDLGVEVTALPFLGEHGGLPIHGKAAFRIATRSVELPQVALRHDVPAYLERIARCQELIEAGESYELCLTNQLSIAASVEPFDLFRVLRAPSTRRRSRPSSARPESRSSVRRPSVPDGRRRRHGLQTHEGHAARGTDLVEDDLLREELASSVKERAENLMITDLVRNDLGSVARPGSVRVDRLFGVETYPHVHQLVSTVSAFAADGVSLMDVVAATFPGGSMTGVPKRRSTELLDELEGGPRGIYSGANGFLSFDERLDFSTVIRTAVVTPEEVTVGVGGAITELSDPEEEVAQMQLKGAAVLLAIGAAARLRSRATG